MRKPDLFLSEESLNEIREDMIKRDAQYRADKANEETENRKILWEVSIVSAAIGSVIGAIVALIVEHIFF